MRRVGWIAVCSLVAAGLPLAKLAWAEPLPGPEHTKSENAPAKASPEAPKCMKAPKTRIDAFTNPAYPTMIKAFWFGEFRKGAAEKLRAAVEANRNPRITTVKLDLDSGGGSYEEGRRVIEVLRALKTSLRLETYVGADSLCASMCVPIFLEGHDRITARSSEWVFHEVANVQRDAEDCAVVCIELKPQKTDEIFESYLRPKTRNPEWLGELRRRIAGGGEVTVTGSHLIAVNSGFITGRAEPWYTTVFSFDRVPEPVFRRRVLTPNAD